MRFLRSIINSYNTPKNKGDFGEMIVKSIFNLRSLKNKEHYLINNMCFSDSSGNSHQIDHVVIMENGVFVLETKNIFGYIAGSISDHYWAITNGGKKYNYIKFPRRNRRCFG